MTDQIKDFYKARWNSAGTVGKIGIGVMIVSGLSILITSALTVRANIVPFNQGLIVIGLSAIVFLFGFITRLFGGFLEYRMSRKANRK